MYAPSDMLVLLTVINSIIAIIKAFYRGEFLDAFAIL